MPVLQLYEQGADGAGVEIMSHAPYEPVTIERSSGLRPRLTNRVTLRDTGTLTVFLCPSRWYSLSRDQRVRPENAKLIS